MKLQHDWLELLDYKIDKKISDKVCTQFPAVITNVDDLEANQMVNVKPLIMRLYEDGILDTPEVFACPVVYPSGGGGALTFPYAEGDTVWVEVSQRSLSEWLYTSGEPIPSKDYNNFNLNDAVVTGGIHTAVSNLTPNPTDVELKFLGMSIKLLADKTIEIVAPEGNITVNNMVIDKEGNINTPGTITATGEITSGSVTLTGHTHPYLDVDTAAGTVPTPIPSVTDPGTG